MMPIAQKKVLLFHSFRGNCERGGQIENFIAVCVCQWEMISVNQQEDLQLSQMFLNHFYVEMNVFRVNID